MNKKFKRIIQYALTAAILCGLLCYITYHALNGFFSDIETTAVKIGTYNKSLDAQAYIFRDETPLMRKIDGAVSYSVDSGHRVAVGQTIAEIYTADNGNALLAELDRINKSIRLLEDSTYSDTGSVVGADKIEDDIRNLLWQIDSALYFGDISQADELADGMLSKMNRYLQMTTSGVDISSEISSLEKEKTLILKKLGDPSEKISSDSSGYFYSFTDGYEYLFTVDKLENLDLASFEKLTVTEAQNFGERCIGKIAYSYEWYFVVKSSVKLISRFSVGQNYDVDFLSGNSKVINATLTKIVTEASGDDALLIFKSEIMPYEFDFRRCQNVSILGDEYSGLKIPTNSLRVVDGVSGVYILYGNTVYFRCVDIIGEAEGYYYVYADSDGITLNGDDEDPDNDVYYKPLREYDRVITSGTGLYDGKVIG